MSRHQVAPNCFFESDESEAPRNPIRGVNKGSHAPKEPAPYVRASTLDDIPDNYLERMRRLRGIPSPPVAAEKTPTLPEGYAVTIAYNKGGYQIVPKEDLNSNREFV